MIILGIMMKKYRLTNKDGEVKWYNFKSQSISISKDNSEGRMYGVLIDIDEQIKRQEELSYLSYMFEQTLVSVKVGSFVIDRDGHPGYIWLADNTASILVHCRMRQCCIRLSCYTIM